MALEFGGTKDPSLIGLKRFERAAGHLKVDQKVLTNQVKETVKQALDTWPVLIKQAPITDKMQTQLVERLHALPLAREIMERVSLGI
jgi:hypothetical protein